MTFVWILLLAFSALCTEISWDEYKKMHKLNFENEEEVLRKNIFEENVRMIEAENAMGHSYTLAINHFAHWTKEELNSMFMNPQQVDAFEKKENEFEKYSADDEETLSEEVTGASINVDWRRNGYVTSVKYQGGCGSCYTFGTTANLESARAMKSNVLEDLSPQQVLDCGNNHGCRGGSDVRSYNYLTQFGSMPWSSYPYRERKGSCKYNKSAVVAKPRYWVHVTGGRDKDLLESVMKRPTSVRIHSDVGSFIYYSSGTYDDIKCTSNVVDHMLIVVGVYENSDDEYYILKNSWGTNWGMNGYMHLSKKRKNLCAIASYPTYMVMP